MTGLLKTQVQIGDSTTAGNNFVLTSAIDNGTMKLARGNFGATTQDILTVDSSGNLTCNDLNKLFTPIDNTSASSDVSLLIGQSIFITASGATSFPLHIAISDGQVYEMYFWGQTPDVAGSVDWVLRPNNVNYGAVFTYRYIAENQTTPVAGVAGSGGTGFFIGNGAASAQCFFKVLIANSLGAKNTIAIFSALNTSANWTGVNYSYWQDTTTAWTSLGTLYVGNNQAFTGKIIIKRIQ